MRHHPSRWRTRGEGDFSDSSKILPDGRTLFLVHVTFPPDARERETCVVLQKCGTVENVLFDFDVKESHNDVGVDESDI
jgi:ribosomal RNA-processing protein 7